jgi:hypothetical protein
VDATARWSDPQGSSPTSTSGPPASPTSRLDSVVDGPLAITQSIRSSVSFDLISGGGVPGVQVSPGRATGSGWTSRYESRKPASASAFDTGHSSDGQSRCEGEFMSPVRNTGTPRRASGASARR